MLDFKEDKQATGETAIVFNCFVKDCNFRNHSASGFYDHLKIVHKFMLFEDRQKPGEKLNA